LPRTLFPWLLHNSCGQLCEPFIPPIVGETVFLSTPANFRSSFLGENYPLLPNL
jgi:hypothetical protein